MAAPRSLGYDKVLGLASSSSETKDTQETGFHCLQRNLTAALDLCILTAQMMLRSL